MDVALEEAADLRTSIKSADASSRSTLLFSKRCHYQDRRDQGQDFGANSLVLFFILRSVERSFYPRPLEQEDRSEEQEGAAGGGSSSHHDSDTLTHEQTYLGTSRSNH